MLQRPLVVALFALAVLAGCGTEVGRIPFTAEGAGETQVTLKAESEVRFWTDLEIEYQGKVAINYQIELLQDGAVVAAATCNPLGNIDVKLKWVETNLNDSHSRSGSGRMQCSAKVPKTGPTTVKASLSFGSRPPGLILKRADLVLKQ
jgi:hypothetical protein